MYTQIINNNKNKYDIIFKYRFFLNMIYTLYNMILVFNPNIILFAMVKITSLTNLFARHLYSTKLLMKIDSMNFFLIITRPEKILNRIKNIFFM